LKVLEVADRYGFFDDIMKMKVKSVETVDDKSRKRNKKLSMSANITFYVIDTEGAFIFVAGSANKLWKSVSFMIAHMPEKDPVAPTGAGGVLAKVVKPTDTTNHPTTLANVINVKDGDGKSPLYYACQAVGQQGTSEESKAQYAKRKAVCDELVKHGAMRQDLPEGVSAPGARLLGRETTAAVVPSVEPATTQKAPPVASV